jgi:sucrose-6-phosphate hydrolase SacC (GH32 family)
MAKAMKDQADADRTADLGTEVSDGPNPRRTQGIRWENHDQAQYFVGRIGPAKFEINSGVGGMFGAMFSFAGDCYAVLSTAKTVGEAKRFCEWIARGYGFDVSG